MRSATPPNSTQQLKNYAAHGPIIDQATGFLTQIIATVTIYTSVTGACWIVVSGNILGVGNTMLQCILGLHIALSMAVATSLWGLGNNFIQRLNFAQWLGIVFWRDITVLGGTNVSWRGLPNNDVSTRGIALEDLAGNSQHLIQSFEEWQSSITRKPLGSRFTGILKWDFRLRYIAPNWPSLRLQRLWFVMPLFAGIFSFVFLLETHYGGATRKSICKQAAQTLSFRNTAPISREALERSRYLFDKAGCELRLLEPKP